MLRTLLGAMFAVVCLSSVSTTLAQSPDPSLSSAFSIAGQPVSLMVLPDASGDSLIAAIPAGPGTVDATIEVYVQDALGFPIPNIPAEDIWLETEFGGLVPCVDGANADGPTDLSGMTTFSAPPAAGGHSSYGAGDSLYVVVQGIRINSWPLEISFNSPDINGDGQVTVADEAIFLGDFSGPYHYRSDFNWDGAVGTPDQFILLDAMGAQCATVETITVDVEPDGSNAPWQLDGPLGFTYSGSGDDVLSGLDLGNYTITWQEQICYGTPTPAQETQELLPGGSILFTGNYTAYGTVNLLPSPAVDEALWAVYGPAPFDSVFGRNQFPLSCVPPGDYTVLWNSEPGWYHDCPGPQVQSLAEGGSISFLCDFHPFSTLDLQLLCTGGGCSVPWILDGPGAYHAEGNDSATLDSLVAGSYTLQLGPVPGHYATCPEVQIIDLAEGATEIVSCSYLQYSTLTLDFTPELFPDLLPPSFSISGPSGYSGGGAGDTVLTDLVAGSYYITFEERGCWTLLQSNPTAIGLGNDEHPVLNVEHVPDGVVRIDAEPDSINATWRLIGPAPYDTTGVADGEISCLTPGDYTLQWQPVSGWFLPQPSAELRTMAPAETLSFAGEYGGTGNVAIVAEPESLQIRWELFGPAAWDTTGTGSDTLFMQPVGTYVFSWNDTIPFWTPPKFPGDQDTLTVLIGQTSTTGGEWLPGPEIDDVSDVGNDQGRQVRVGWIRNAFDHPIDGPIITGYSVYRRRDEYKRGSPSLPGPAQRKLAGWDYLLTVPARTDDYYQAVVPTLCDSTDAGICSSTFMVSAMTDQPWLFYDSYPMEGYSVDNLSPAPPAKLAVDFLAAGNQLSWEESPDTDIRAYRVYRASRNGASCDPPTEPPIAELSELNWTDSAGGWDDCYYISAVDHAGNEGEPTLWADATVTRVAPSLPTKFALHAPVPNPFNPFTTLSFDLSKGGRARLVIFNASGRRVRTVLDESFLPPGRYEREWRGIDDSGRQVATGVYFVHLFSDEGERTRRVALVR